MRYSNLNELVHSSRSSREYFFSLPVEMQMALGEHRNYIHTAEELHQRVYLIKKLEHQCELGKWETQ